jgi:glutaredoxin-related protein
MRLKLYSRQDCPLCEEVEQQLNALGIEYDFIDIDESVQLIKQYNSKVPVLMNSLKKSLFWPFDESTLESFINEK